jgi:outer membrane protein TolC
VFWCGDKARDRRVQAALVCAVLMFSLASFAPAAWAQSAPAAATAAREVDLPLAPFVRQIREANKAILSKRTEQAIAGTGIERASAAFQPQASVSVLNGRQRLKNTPEEALIRQNLGIYDRTGVDYSMGVSQLLESGTKLEAKATMSKFLTNVTRNIRPTDDDDYKTFYGLTLTQPLARDAGRDVTMARTRVAELDTRAAEFASGDTEASVVAEAVFAYWDLLLAQERSASAVEKVRMGERLLQEARALNRQGRLPQSEIWEVENNLGRFQAGLSEARQGVQERVNKLRTLLMTAANTAPASLRASDQLPVVRSRPVPFEDAMRRALDRRDDYRMRKVMVEREGIQLAYANNQGLPKIDLVASYGLNGLELSAARSLSYARMNDFPTWSLGVQLSMPLGENRQARADVQAATLRRQDALLQLKALEVAIANDIDTGIGMLSSATERWTLWREVAEREQRQLELERTRLTAGRSDMREILLREERAINARLAVVEQQVAWSKADVLLEAAQGQLLDRWR